MNELVIYQSKNNGLGGEMDYFNNNLIFKESSRHCFYIKNTGTISKRLFQVSIDSVDEVNLGIVMENEEVLRNQLSPIISGSNSPIGVVFNLSLINPNIVLEPNDFIILWLKLNNSTHQMKSTHTMSINLEWADEY